MVLRILAEQSLRLPESVRMILVVNPKESLYKESPPTQANPAWLEKEKGVVYLSLPPSFLQVTLTTPYRSTIAITSLARFIATCKGLNVPDGDFGSDVEGIKPIFFDVGNDVRKLEEALEHCHKHLRDNVTILYDENLPSSMQKMAKEQGKEAGGAWECYEAFNYYGWEAERVVAVTDGWSIMELITRARTHLAVILVEGYQYAKHKEHFQQAADLGLVEIVELSATAVEIN